MIPTSISASALEVAQDCMAKWEATYLRRGAGFQNDAAKLGTTLHSALEAWVTQERMNAGSWDEGMLIVLFKMAFFQNFSVMDMEENEWYKQGIAILKHWYNRTGQMQDIQSGTIISKEKKLEFNMPYLLDKKKEYVPFRYIIDRLDQLEDDVFRVVDYKSQRSPFSADEMYKKIQPRAYALAVQLAYPTAKRIWVQFDFLRYSAVSIVFTPDDNRSTWKYIQRLLQRIVDTPEGKAEMTLGPGCQYCIKRVTCPSAMSNAAAGGILGLSIEEMAELYSKLEAQVSAQKGILDNIGDALLLHARQEDMTEMQLGKFDVSVRTSSRREINNEELRNIVGDEVMSSYGKINVGDIERIKKDVRLTDEQRSMLVRAVMKKNNRPSIRVKPHVEIEE